MGIDDALKDYADFSGICEGEVKLKVKHVFHKTVLDVEEVKTKGGGKHYDFFLFNYRKYLITT